MCYTFYYMTEGQGERPPIEQAQNKIIDLAAVREARAPETKQGIPAQQSNENPAIRAIANEMAKKYVDTLLSKDERAPGELTHENVVSLDASRNRIDND